MNNFGLISLLAENVLSRVVGSVNELVTLPTPSGINILFHSPNRKKHYLGTKDVMRRFVSALLNNKVCKV